MKHQGGSMTLEIFLLATAVISAGLLFFGMKKDKAEKYDKMAELEQEVQNLSGVIHGYAKSLETLNNLFINLNKHVKDISEKKTGDYSDEFDEVQQHIAQLRDQQVAFNNTINSRIDSVAKGMPKMIELSLKKIQSPVPIEISRKPNNYKTLIKKKIKKVNGGYETIEIRKEVPTLPGKTLPGLKESRASLVRHDL